jgi:hypothetical protein
MEPIGAHAGKQRRGGSWASGARQALAAVVAQGPSRGGHRERARESTHEGQRPLTPCRAAGAADQDALSVGVGAT